MKWTGRDIDLTLLMSRDRHALAATNRHAADRRRAEEGRWLRLWPRFGVGPIRFRRLGR